MNSQPADQHAEQAVLGAMLTSATVIDDVSRLLRGPDFYRPTHEWVFDAILDLAQRREPADPITVAEHLRRAGQLEQAGGLPMLADLVSAASTPGSVAHHAAIIRDKAVLRRLVDAGTAIRDDAYTASTDASTVLTRAQVLVDGISPPTERQAGTTVADAWPAVIEQVERGGVRGPSLPWVDLDALLQGLNPGAQYTIAARPGAGKSIMGQALAAHWADAHGRDVYIASYEMQAAEISMRLLSAKSGVAFGRLRSGDLTERDWEAVSRASQWPAAGRIHISDDTSATIQDVRAGVRDLARRGNLGLVVIDYAGIVAKRDPALTQQQHVSEVSSGAKQLAMELAVPVVLLAQLNRDGVQRGKDAPPVLTDLRDSGSLEQDADAVLLLHLPLDEHTGEASTWNLRAIVAKNRSGEQGRVDLVRQGHLMRIVNRERPPASHYGQHHPDRVTYVT